MSNEVTGQSGQSQLHTVGEHRPGGPCNRRTGRYERTSGLQLHCSMTGPGVAWPGTGGEAGPGTDVKPSSAAAAGGPCWEPPILSWPERSPVDGGGAMVDAMDTNGARRRSNEPSAARPELGLRGSDGRSLRTAGPEHHAGPREMPAGHGWTGLRAEAHGGPGRAGQRSKMYRSRLVTQLCQQPTETVFFRSRLRPFIGQSAIVIETRFHAIDSTISYDTISWARDRACASPHIRYVSIGQPSARMRPG